MFQIYFFSINKHCNLETNNASIFHQTLFYREMFIIREGQEIPGFWNAFDWKEKTDIENNEHQPENWVKVKIPLKSLSYKISEFECSF